VNGDPPLFADDLEAMPRGDRGVQLVPACHRQGVKATYGLGELVLACRQCGRPVARILVASRPKPPLHPLTLLSSPRA
jgi:hypothetical protein